MSSPALTPDEVSCFLKAGIESMAEMSVLADAGIRGQDAATYAQCGFSVEDMFQVANAGIASWACRTVISHGITEAADVIRTVVGVQRSGIALSEWVWTRKFVTNSFDDPFRSRLLNSHLTPQYTARTVKHSAIAYRLLERCDDNDFRVVVHLTEEGGEEMPIQEFQSLIEILRG